MFELGWGRIRYYYSLCIFSFSQQCIQCRLGHSKAVSHSSGVAYDQITRSSHLYVLCRSICSQDQNWIKQSKPFWGADQWIKVTSELLKIDNQEQGCNLTFDPWKSSDQEPQKGMIKDTFCRSKTWLWLQILLQVSTPGFGSGRRTKHWKQNKMAGICTKA